MKKRENHAKPMLFHGFTSMNQQTIKSTLCDFYLGSITIRYKAFRIFFAISAYGSKKGKLPHINAIQILLGTWKEVGSLGDLFMFRESKKDWKKTPLWFLFRKWYSESKKEIIYHSKDDFSWFNEIENDKSCSYGLLHFLTSLQ